MTFPLDPATVLPEVSADSSLRIQEAVPVHGLTAVTELSPLLQVAQVRDRASLQGFLEAYRSAVLVPLEWTAILQAYGYALRQETRELISLDVELAREPLLRQFTESSCRVGQRQLSRLRALRDVRLVQRYLAAIEKGEARGWHTLAYGVWLSVFALPLRQGLVHYAEHTLGGFIEGAARPLALSEADCEQLQRFACSSLPRLLEPVLETSGQGGLRLT